jgi:predicted dithiol-disulfide oxidoreductase (DUF899 family)
MDYEGMLRKKGWADTVPHTIGTPEEYLKARLELLEEEKSVTHQLDKLARKRQALPWVEVTKPYVFHSINGSEVTFSDLFRDGKQDLFVYHMMYEDKDPKPCPGCSSCVDSFTGVWEHVAQKCNFAVIAKASPKKLVEASDLKGWKLPLYSSAGTTFNHDMHVEFDQSELGKKLYNHGTSEVSWVGQTHSVSVFRKVGDKIYLTYQTFCRGVEMVNPMNHILDLMPDGRGVWGPDHKEEYPKLSA